jgi:HPt (histidine-containing phosphotransfer) domain-containing protein
MAMALPEPPGFSRDVVQRVYRGNERLYGRARALFLASATGLLQDVEASLEGADHGRIAALAHKLRGSAVLVGAARLGHLLGTAEAGLLPPGEIDGWRQAARAALDAYAQVLVAGPQRQQPRRPDPRSPSRLAHPSAAQSPDVRRRSGARHTIARTSPAAACKDPPSSFPDPPCSSRSFPSEPAWAPLSPRSS